MGVYDRSEVITPAALVEASTWTIGSDRQVTLIAPTTPESPIAATCAVSK
jgi:hypothetical protein